MESESCCEIAAHTIVTTNTILPALVLFVFQNIWFIQEYSMPENEKPHKASAQACIIFAFGIGFALIALSSHYSKHLPLHKQSIVSLVLGALVGSLGGLALFGTSTIMAVATAKYIFNWIAFLLWVTVVIVLTESRMKDLARSRRGRRRDSDGIKDDGDKKKVQRINTNNDYSPKDLATKQEKVTKGENRATVEEMAKRGKSAMRDETQSETTHNFGSEKTMVNGQAFYHYYSTQPMFPVNDPTNINNGNANSDADNGAERKDDGH